MIESKNFRLVKIISKSVVIIGQNKCKTQTIEQMYNSAANSSLHFSTCIATEYIELRTHSLCWNLSNFWWLLFSTTCVLLYLTGIIYNNIFTFIFVQYIDWQPIQRSYLRLLSFVTIKMISKSVAIISQTKCKTPTRLSQVSNKCIS